MNRTWLNNWGLKIISVLVAVLLWFIVLFIEDPITTETIIDVPVTISNEEIVTESGKVYSVEDGSDKIKVTVTGKGSVVKTLGPDSFVATADMEEMLRWDTSDSDVMLGTISIQISCKDSRIKRENIKIAPETVKVSIEEKTSASFVIKASTEGTTPATGFAVGEMPISPLKVTISGPKSIVGIIDRVVAPVNVTGITTDTDFPETQLYIYDKNGEKFTDSQMEALDLDTNSRKAIADVSVDLWQVVTDVALEVAVTGSPIYGYGVTGVEVAPDKISVAGTDEALAALAEAGNKISIADVLDVSDKASDVEESIDITSYLPEGIKIAGDSSETIVVTARIAQSNKTSKVIDINISAIGVIGKQADLDLKFENSNSIKVEIKGVEDDIKLLEDMDSTFIKSDIDLSSYTTAGTYTVKVNNYISSSYIAALEQRGVNVANLEFSEVTCSITLSEKTQVLTETKAQ